MPFALEIKSTLYLIYYDFLLDKIRMRDEKGMRISLIRQETDAMETETLIGIVDNQTLMRTSIKQVINAQSGMKVIFESSGASKIFDDSNFKKCGLIITELTLWMLNGMNLTVLCTEMKPAKKVIIYTSHRSLELAQTAIGMGASGYILKSDSIEVILDSIRNAMSGKIVMSPQFADPLVDLEKDRLPSYHMIIQLSTAERDVLSLMLAGLTSKQIALVLGVAKTTIDKHREHIRDKTGNSSMFELLFHAKKYGLI